MEGAAEGDSGSRQNEIQRSKLGVRASTVSNVFIKRTWTAAGEHRGSWTTLLKLWNCYGDLALLTWSHCITHTFIPLPSDFGGTVVNVCWQVDFYLTMKQSQTELLVPPKKSDSGLRNVWFTLELLLLILISRAQNTIQNKRWPLLRHRVWNVVVSFSHWR